MVEPLRLAGGLLIAYYLLTGKPITGAAAAAIGLITEAVPGDQLDARVAEIADELAQDANGGGCIGVRHWALMCKPAPASLEDLLATR